MVTKVTRSGGLAGGSFTLIDENGLPETIRALRSFENRAAEIGVLNQETMKRGHSHAITPEHLAVILHNGCRIRVTKKMRAYLGSLGIMVSKNLRWIHIPARPFLDVSMNQIDAMVEREIALALDRAIVYASPTAGEEGMEKVAKAAQEIIRKATIDFGTPRNHPWTIYLKGDDNPLEDTGQLQDNIEYVLGRVEG